MSNRHVLSMQFETSWRVVSHHRLNAQRDLVQFPWSFTKDHGDGTNGRWRSPNPPNPSLGQEVESAFKRGAGARRFRLRTQHGGLWFDARFVGSLHRGCSGLLAGHQLVLG